jgi:hypothetical protein
MERTGIANTERSLTSRLLSRAVASGSVAGLAATAAVALSGVREAGSGAAPINATSHVLWGRDAGTTDAVDVKHTLPGLLINVGAGVFWGVVYELLRESLPRRDRASAVGSGAVVSGLAYLVDYHLIPRRLTPGWELRVSRRSVRVGFAALGLGLAAMGLLRARR